MVYGILRKLESEGRLRKCSIALFRKDVKGRKEFIFGRDIVDIDRSCVSFLGGECGQERHTGPREAIREVESGGRAVFRRKKRIERVYPKKRR